MRFAARAEAGRAVIGIPISPAAGVLPILSAVASPLHAHFHESEIAMASAGWDLQKAVYAALAADGTLTTLLGGAAIHDAAPQDAAFPYIVIDQTQIRDWSTGAEPGAEHMLMLHVWSRYAGKREAYEIADAVRAVLDGALLSLEDHRLVNLRHQYSELKRDADGETQHGVLRFRAVTEPLG